MKLQLSTYLAFAATTIATSVRYDNGYDDSSRSLGAVACSNGVNGLETKYGFTIQGNIPIFPNVGSSWEVGGWNSSNCGTCYKVSYLGNSIYFLAIDVATEGIVMSEAAMNKLTNGQAVFAGVVDANVERVDTTYCIPWASH